MINQKNMFFTLDQNQLKEFVRSRTGMEGYFSLISVRHPFARLYSAYKDKFRNGHPWFKFIDKKFGKYLNMFEKKNMTEEPFETSFEEQIYIFHDQPGFQHSLSWHFLIFSR